MKVLKIYESLVPNKISMLLNQSERNDQKPLTNKLINAGKNSTQIVIANTIHITTIVAPASMINV